MGVAGHQSERTMEAGRLPPASLTRELALPRDMNSSGGALSVRSREWIWEMEGGREGGRKGGRKGGRDGGREREKEGWRERWRERGRE